MATFPTLTPGSRTFTPGEYPHATFAGMSGKQSRVRNSNVMLSSQLRLRFVAIPEAQMLSILSHYQGQYGSFNSFALPSAIWSGVSDVADYQLSGYGWRYMQPPTVTDAMCADAYDVELTLETVPPEGTAIAGLDFVIAARLTPGTAFSAVGANLTVTASIEVGGAGAEGLSQTVTASLAAGAVATDVNEFGIIASVPLTISGGSASGGVYPGITASVTWSIAGGSASSSNNTFTWTTPNTSNPPANAYRLYGQGAIVVNGQQVNANFMRLSTTVSTGYQKTKLLLLTAGTSVTMVVKGVTHTGTVATSATLEDANSGTERVVLHVSFSSPPSATTVNDGPMTMTASVF